MLKNIKNWILILIGVISYIYIMFFSNIELGTGKKELENIFVLAIPCFILLIQSFKIKDKKERKKYLFYYLLFYIIAMLGFTFSNFRLAYKRLGDVNFVREFNLIPFKSIHQLLISPLGKRMAFYNIIGNLLMLTPLSILLPLINDKFRGKKYFLPAVLLTTVLVETFEFLTNCGSFDIDDIILNFLGAFIVYLFVRKGKIYNCLKFIFYKFTFNKPYIKYIEILLFIFLIFIYYNYYIAIRQIHNENIYNISNLKCINNNKTYIISIGEFDYYSNCEYSGYVVDGNNINYELKDFLNKNNDDDTLNKLGITKEKWLESIDIDYSDNINDLILINAGQRTKTYMVGIKSINIKIKKHNYNKDILINGDNTNLDFNYLSLVNITESSKTHAIFVGNYYNVIGCKEEFSLGGEDYIIPKNYNYDSNFCSTVNNLNKNNS